MVEHGADEGWELGVLFASLGLKVSMFHAPLALVSKFKGWIMLCNLIVKVAE